MFRFVISFTAVVALTLLSIPAPPITAGNEAAVPGRRVSAVDAPVPAGPPNAGGLLTLGPVPFSWQMPAGATQYHLQVIPFNGDGPGVNLIRNVEPGYTLEAPVFGTGPYILLPGMSYTWRVRASDATVGLSDSDPAWGPWSDAWSFTTPRPNPASLQLRQPAEGATVSGPFSVVWTDDDASLFYYEVQVSADPTFNTDPETATTSVFWNLVHGGQSQPPNSWPVPFAALKADTRHYWRVRARVQGDGIPAEWTAPASFVTAGAPPAGPAPDLAVTDLQTSARFVLAGGQVKVTYTVKNLGVGPSAPAGVNAVLSTSVIVTPSQTDLGAIGTIPALSPGQASPEFSTNVTVPQATAPGDYFLGVYVDWSGANQGDPNSLNNGIGNSLNVVTQCPGGGAPQPDFTCLAPVATPRPTSTPEPTPTPPCAPNETLTPDGECAAPVVPPTATPTFPPDPTPAPTATCTADQVPTDSGCRTRTPTPTVTGVATATLTATATGTPATATATPTGETATPTGTATPTAPATATPTATATVGGATSTPTATPTAGSETTPTATATTAPPTATPTPANTPTATATIVVTPTATPTATTAPATATATSTTAPATATPTPVASMAASAARAFQSGAGGGDAAPIVAQWLAAASAALEAVLRLFAGRG